MGDGARLFWILFGAIGTGYAVHRVLRRKDGPSTPSERPTIMPLPQPQPAPSEPPRPPPPPMTSDGHRFEPLVERWRFEIAKRAGDLPVDPLLTWIAMESGGDMSSTGTSTEVGIWQLNLPGGNDDSKYGATLEGLRSIAKKSDEQARQGRNPMDLSWMTPAELDMQVGAGIRKVLAARDTVRKVLAANGATWPETSRDFGAAIKQVHGLPAVIGDLFPRVTRKLGRPIASWDEFRREAVAFPVDQMVDAHGKPIPLARYARAPSVHPTGPHDRIPKQTSRMEDTLVNADIFGKAWARAFA